MLNFPLPAHGNRGRKTSESEPGLHDTRFLPSCGLGIGRPEPAGGRHRSANVKSGVFVGPEHTGCDSKRPTGPNVQGASRGVSDNSRKEIRR